MFDRLSQSLRDIMAKPNESYESRLSNANALKGWCLFLVEIDKGDTTYATEYLNTHYPIKKKVA
jgi:hypothetical protein